MLTNDARCLYRLLQAQARQTPAAYALLAPGRKTADYRQLLERVDQTARTLSALGIGRGDRVAFVLPDGPETVVLFLAITAMATCAPLNPAYRHAEFSFYLADLKPKALVALGGMAEAVAAARDQGIPVIELTPDDSGEAGTFSLRAEAGQPGSPADPVFALPEDIALVLHTSGTTARPKIVPLTQANLWHSARNVAATLALGSSDRCLSIMPTFHVHGLVGGILSSLSAGASVVCTAGFHAPGFFEWMDEFRPTWYTGVPTMHQAILGRAAQHRESVARANLRFIRSCSSPLAPRVMEQLETTFRVPVIEAYGMTEAAHQMAVNPLPPRARKPGSAGLAGGCSIAIMNEQGVLLGPGDTGEVVIQGPGVTPGYENNPAANESAFAGGWFHTGDRGYLDAEGYLFLTGRTKEMINRGGEKISPREVDEALLEHPAVAQAIAFALPDERLGEEVAAAVVLRPDAAATGIELREFVARKLADFKVPRRIVFVSEIPKGPTGKPQRIGLAAKLGMAEPAGPAAPASPRSDAETRMASLWSEVLGVPLPGMRDDFFAAGGDSLLAVQLAARIRSRFGLDCSIIRLLENPTVAGMAGLLESAHPAGPSIRAVPRDPGPALSFAQERIWFLAQVEADRALYNRPSVFRLLGPLDIPALEHSISWIVARHEVLRTTYGQRDGLPTAMISRPTPLRIPVMDLRHLTPAERAAEVSRRIGEEYRRPFDLSRDLMIRAALLALGETEHLLVVTAHHIAWDGWSTDIFLQELAALYEQAGSSSPAALPELPVQYADVAHWQREWLQGERLESLLAYWRRQLQGSPPTLGLATDHPRPAVQTSHGGNQSLELPESLSAALGALGRREGATLFMTLLAGFQALLHRYTGDRDIVVGCPLATRGQLETEKLIGLFVNTLPFRTDLSGDPDFGELLRRVRTVALGVYAHQDLSFEKLVDALRPERSLSHTPLFQVVFQLRNYPQRAAAAGVLRIEDTHFRPAAAQFDLTLEVTADGPRLRCLLNYNADLFEAATARRMLGQYRALLESAVAGPERREVPCEVVHC